ncbi:MAG: SMC-Scp complex subunit ScpB [Ruminococcaceae bacterium]|nr:SMC-Scp complex subunit ScpB [Oscillospiraceae bacterium]
MQNKELVKAAQAVIFSSGEPLAISRLSEIFELTPKKTEELVSLVAEDIDKSDLGFTLIRLDDHVQFATKKEYASYIKAAFDIKRKTPLSPAAFEVLAVIAYNQPVTKAFVEQVRGVDCSSVIATLVEKDLVEERGRLELPGRPLLYGTTKNFLRCFSLSSLKDLPPLPESDKNAVDVAEQLEVRPDI